MGSNQHGSSMVRCSCYIYGSTHIKKPSRELLECADKLVEYVLVEGVNTKMRLGFSFTLYWLPLILTLFFYFKFLRLVCRLKGHRPDMEEIADFFRARGKHVEVVDRDLRSAVEFCFKDVKRWLPLLTLLWFLGIPALMWLIPGLPLTIISLPPGMPIASTASQALLILAMFIYIVVPPLIVARYISSRDCMLYRDTVVIEKVVELINRYGILIARGQKHVGYMKEALESINIACYDLEKICKQIS